jgi:hypothetical protein
MCTGTHTNLSATLMSAFPQLQPNPTAAHLDIAAMHMHSTLLPHTPSLHQHLRLRPCAPTQAPRKANAFTHMTGQHLSHTRASLALSLSTHPLPPHFFHNTKPSVHTTIPTPLALGGACMSTKLDRNVMRPAFPPKSHGSKVHASIRSSSSSSSSKA